MELESPREKTAIGRVARMATEVAQPPLVLSVLLIITSAVSAPLPSSLVPGMVAAFSICIVPWTAVIILARRGKLTDHHVGDRKQRRPVMIWTLCSALLGCLVLALTGAPAPLWGLIAGILAGVLALILISPVWKMSGHALTLGGTATFASLQFGWWALPLIVGAPLVCWSRVFLRDHTARQVIVGFVTGAVAFAAAWVLFVK